MKPIFITLAFVFWLCSQTIYSQAAMVKDINLGSSDSYPLYLTNVKGTLYFKAQTATFGPELWKSDGTAAGTVMVKDIYPGSGTGWWPHSLINFNDTLYFIANDGTTGYELWKSDGTAAGTALVKEINPSTFGALDAAQNENALINFSGALYFIAYNGINGTELWKSDGTTAGTVMVKNISNGALGTAPSTLANINGTLFFGADDGVNGYELWKSDGTTLGTVMVKDIYPGSNGSSAGGPFTNVNGILYFWANTVSYGTELWKSDGTALGTEMVMDINPGATSGLGSVNDKNASLNGFLYFAADDGTNGKELWKTDGTLAGTVMVKDIYPGASGSTDLNLTVLNGAVFFEANDGTNGYELWKSDGTGAGTMMVKDISPGNSQSICPYSLTNVNDTLYFCGQDGVNGNELWTSDGTTVGTVMVADIYPGGGNSTPYYYTNVNGTIYFWATDGTHGVELWKYDPTFSTVVKEINFENTISIYPNPFSTHTTLQTNHILTDATLTIYNTFGQLVKQIKNISGQTVTLFRENLLNGLYFVCLTQDNKVISTNKLLITDDRH